MQHCRPAVPPPLSELKVRFKGRRGDICPTISGALSDSLLSVPPRRTVPLLIKNALEELFELAMGEVVAALLTNDPNVMAPLPKTTAFAESLTNTLTGATSVYVTEVVPDAVSSNTTGSPTRLIWE